VITAREIPVREAARRVRRSPETVRRWIWSGRLPATKRGNTYYVDVMHLEGIAVEMGIGDFAARHTESTPSGHLAAWLAEVDRWKSGLPAAAGAAAGSTARLTASDLVLEDRHARR
jgi:excisionase family DNA binding protein